jgi:hypothetical protein
LKRSPFLSTPQSSFTRRERERLGVQDLERELEKGLEGINEKNKMKKKN